MQDLGRIVIDINESGSSKAEGISGIGNMNEDSAGGAAGAAEEIGSLAEVASTAAAAFTVVIGAFAAMAKVVGKVADALIALNRFVMEVANDLRDYSPGIQLAEMQNQIAMVNTKFRAGMQYGGAIGAQMLEVGRIERSFVEIKAAFAGIGSIFLKPITKGVADVADYMKGFIPKVIEYLATYADGLGKLFASLSAGSSKLGLPSWLSSSTLSLSKAFYQMGRDLRSIKQNTDPKIDYGAMNEPFFQDLRLMGVKGI